MLDLRKEYTCPYCGSSDTLLSFLIKKKNGKYNQGYVKCSNCGERMRRNTLYAKMSFFEWGLWLYLNIRMYNSPHYKFYDKIHFESLHKNLDLMGRMYKKEFFEGFKYGKENWYNKGELLLNELNEKYNIDIMSRYKQLNLKNKFNK